MVIIDGPFKNYEGAVDSVDVDRAKMTVLVLIFDRDTPVELDFTQVRKKQGLDYSEKLFFWFIVLVL